MLLSLSVSAFALLFGIVIGSFLNVLIFRIPQKEDFIRKPSHCMSCEHSLRWYDLIPLFSWLFLKGKCRYCKAPISKQYPLIELSNGLLWFAVFFYTLYFGGFSFEAPELIYRALILSLMCSALLALSVIDFRTYEIPVGFNIFIFGLGAVRLIFDLGSWKSSLIGLICVSLPLFLIFAISKGRAIGGGDVKLMASCGFLLGWKMIVFAFILGCILGAVIHSIRMKSSNADHVLAMGPYLSMGVVISLFACEPFISWYTSLLV